MRILVALSGGIDSSVVAHLLREQGHDLVGVRFTLWSDPLAPAIAQILPSKCCNAQTAMRAAAVAKKLAIPYHIVDLEADFKREVVDPFLEGYRAGRTPNPCIRCNRTIKFGKLFDVMKELGCERMATGHYARTARETTPDGSERTLLLEATAAAKDQSYYLYGLSQEQLRHALFPLGAMRKEEVFALAKHYGVPHDEHYRESMDLCFFPEKTPQAFLRRHLKDALQPGKIVRRDGTVVGTHKGLPLYTIGQRHGLGIGGLKIPLEVVAKDAAANTLVVADRGTESVTEILVEDLRWVSWQPGPSDEAPFECRTRSLTVRQKGRLKQEGGHGLFRFDMPQPPPAPGQALVLYRGEEVVGGGTIVE